MNDSKFLIFYSYFCLIISIFLFFLSGNEIMRLGMTTFSITTLTVAITSFVLSLYMGKKQVWAYKWFFLLIPVSWVAFAFATGLGIFSIIGSMSMGIYVLPLMFLAFVAFAKARKLYSIQQTGESVSETNQVIEEPTKIKLVSFYYPFLLLVIDLWGYFAVLRLPDDPFLYWGYGIQVAIGLLIMTVAYIITALVVAIILNKTTESNDNLFYNLKFIKKITVVNFFLLFLTTFLIYAFWGNKQVEIGYFSLGFEVLQASLGVLITAILVNIPFYGLKIYRKNEPVRQSNIEVSSRSPEPQKSTDHLRTFIIVVILCGLALTIPLFVREFKTTSQKNSLPSYIGNLANNPYVLLYKDKAGTYFIKRGGNTSSSEDVLNQMPAELGELEKARLVYNFLITQNSVYIFETQPLINHNGLIIKKINADPETFQQITEHYFKDKRSIYFANADDTTGFISPMIFEEIYTSNTSNIKADLKLMMIEYVDLNKSCEEIGGLSDNNNFYYYRLTQNSWGLKQVDLKLFDLKEKPKTSKLDCWVEY